MASNSEHQKFGLCTDLLLLSTTLGAHAVGQAWPGAGELAGELGLFLDS